MRTAESPPAESSPTPQLLSTTRGILAFLVWSLVVGCQADDGTDARIQPSADTSDSATNAGAPVAVDTTPRIRIGEMGGPPEEELYRVVSPFLLPDGRLVIPVGGSNVVRVYSGEGVLEATHGREGEGPGEFNGIVGAWPRGDTIEVYDFDLGRITRLIGNDSIEMLTLRAKSPANAPRAPFLDGWLAIGLVNVRPVRLEPGERGVKVDTAVIARLDGAGADLGEVLRLAGLHRYASRERRQVEPLTPDFRVATHGGLIYAGETLEPVIRTVDSTGAMVKEIRWTPDSAPDPEGSLRAVLDLAASREDPFRNPNMPRTDYSDAPVPPRLSVFWGLLVDSDGFVWVLPYDPLKHANTLGGWRGPGPGGRWMVFSPSGARLADIDMPPLLYPSQITRDAIVGIERDPLGVEMVSVYALRRR